MDLQPVVEVTQSFTDTLLSGLIKGAAVALTAALTALVTVGVNELRKRGIYRATAEEERKGKEAVAAGIAATAEWANKTLVTDPNDPNKLIPPTGAMKLEKAKQIAISIHPPLAQEPTPRLEDKVDALLAVMRKDLSLPPLKLDSSNPVANMDAEGHLSGLSRFPAPNVPKEYLDSDTSPGKKTIPSKVPTKPA
jgi:hypothetical protein